MWVLGDIAVSSYAAWISFEIFTKRDGLSVVGTIIEVLVMTVTVVSALAVPLLIHRLRELNREKLVLVRRLETTHMKSETSRLE